MAILDSSRLNLPPDGREALFLLRWTERAQAALFAAPPEGRPVTDEAARACLTELFCRLREACEDVFRVEKNALMARAEPLLAAAPALATAQMRAAASEELLLGLERTGGALIFEKYPLLRGLLDRRTENFIAACRELLERLSRDRAAICRRFFAGGDFGRVTGLDLGTGDPHFHGRSACVVVTERGRLVYKPRDCGIDVKFRELIISLGFSDLLRAPDCLEGEGYGWCEFAAPGEVSSEAGAARFYRRFGGACALMQALGGSDLHSENWVCSGEFPVLVDVETALSPVPRVFNDGRVFPELMPEAGFIYDANRSLLPSSLLPSRRGGRELSALLDGSERTGCGPVLRGKKLTVSGYEAEFLAGFAEGYDRCVARRGELLRALEGFRGVTVRKLLRRTGSYAGLLRRLCGAEALRSEARRAAELGRLGGFFRLHGAESMLPIARREADSLLEGDIPSFSAEGGGHALLCGGEVVVEGFFRRSAVENAAERISRLSEAEKRFELGLLSQGLSRALVPAEPKAAPEPELSDLAPLGREAALAEAQALFREIEALTLTGPGGKSSWLVHSERGANLVPMRPGFFRGGAGLGVFFAAVYASGSAPRAAELAGVCLEQLEAAAAQLEGAERIPEEALPLGMAAGFAGAFRALDIMEGCLGGGRARELKLRLLGLLERADIENARALDLYSGAAGLLLELGREYGRTGAPAVLAQLERTAERLLRGRTLEYRGALLWDTLGKGRPMSGAGHGHAGIAAALAGASKLLGGGKYREAALAALEFEHGAYSEKLGAWPDLRASPEAARAMHGLCSGAPGIGLALLYCKECGLSFPELDEDLDRAKRRCLAAPPLYRDHLCCGNAAALDFLLSLPDCREHAGRLLALMKARRDREGSYRFLPEGWRQVPCPELFFGAAGLGYELLRYARPDGLRQILF